MKVKGTRLIKIGFGLLVTVACLVVALWGIDWSEVARSFGRANYAGLPIMLALLFLFFWLKAIRWKMLLDPLHSFRVRDVVPSMMIGFMGNNLLPVRLGEFVRAWALGRQSKLSKTAIFSTIVLERVFDIVAILAILGIGLVIVREMPQDLRTASWIIAAVTVVGVALLVAYVLLTSHFVTAAEWALDRLAFVPRSMRDGVTRALESGAAGLSSVKSPKLLVGITITSVLQWLINGTMVYVALRSFGLDVTPSMAGIVTGVTAFGVTVPSAPGFFGVVQLCFWISLEPFGMSQADVFSASVYYHLTYYVPVTSIGLLFLSRLGLRLGDIERAAEQAKDLTSDS